MDSPDVAHLSVADLRALRLGAEVLAHRAELDRRGHVGAYFRRLEDAIRGEIARRARPEDRPSAPPSVVEPGAPAEPDDRRVVAEYLGFLIANERLAPAVREFCRALRARDSR